MDTSRASAGAVIKAKLKATAKAVPAKAEPPKREPHKLAPEHRQRFFIEDVSLLASDTSEGKVSLDVLGQSPKRTNPAISPQT